MQAILKQYKGNLFIVTILLLFIVANSYAMYQGQMLLNSLPVVLGILFLTFIRIDIVFFIIIAGTPISIQFMEFMDGAPIDFSIPTEPILFGTLLVVIYKSVREQFIDRKIFNHPVSLAILFYLFWIFFTSVTSVSPLVSFKFLLVRIWFLTTFYIIGIYIFKKPENIKKFMWVFTLSFLIVIIYTTSRHLGYGLSDKQAAHFVMGPFFRDHTSYGAVLAMVIFPYIGINLFQKYSFLRKLVIWGIAGIILGALLLSYSRAAWMSVFVALGVLTATLLKIKFRYLAIVGIVAVSIFYGNRYDILHKLEKNKQDSSADIGEHLKSMSNIATDASNLERLNRWDAAFKMFGEKPIVGWGPGTYMFEYAPFQSSSRRTVISTNFGNLGNAHSEYIGPLAEMGVLGLVSFLIVIVTTLLTAYRVFFKINDKNLKYIVLSVILGYITYLIHGGLNNFLDMDKAASLFWGFTAFFVSLELYYLNSENNHGCKKVDA